MCVRRQQIIALKSLSKDVLLLLATTATKVAVSRKKHEISPPEMNGPPEFLRTIRAQ